MFPYLSMAAFRSTALWVGAQVHCHQLRAQQRLEIHKFILFTHSEAKQPDKKKQEKKGDWWHVWCWVSLNCFTDSIGSRTVNQKHFSSTIRSSLHACPNVIFYKLVFYIIKWHKLNPGSFGYEHFSASTGPAFTNRHLFVWRNNQPESHTHSLFVLARQLVNCCYHWTSRTQIFALVPFLHLLHGGMFDGILSFKGHVLSNNCHSSILYDTSYGWNLFMSDLQRCKNNIWFVS